MGQTDGTSGRLRMAQAAVLARSVPVGAEKLRLEVERYYDMTVCGSANPTDECMLGGCCSTAYILSAPKRTLAAELICAVGGSETAHLPLRPRASDQRLAEAPRVARTVLLDDALPLSAQTVSFELSWSSEALPFQTIQDDAAVICVRLY